MSTSNIHSTKLLDSLSRYRAITGRFKPNKTTMLRIKHIADVNPTRVHDILSIQNLPNRVKMTVDKPVNRVLNRFKYLGLSSRHNSIAFRLVNKHIEGEFVMVRAKGHRSEDCLEVRSNSKHPLFRQLSRSDTPIARNEVD